MNALEPPRFSTWLLQRFTLPDKRDSLMGDLREQYHKGRSAWWYRRQVFSGIVAGSAADLSEHKLLALRAFIVGCAVVVSVFLGHRVATSSVVRLAKPTMAIRNSAAVVGLLCATAHGPFLRRLCCRWMADREIAPATPSDGHGGCLLAVAVCHQLGF